MPARRRYARKNSKKPSFIKTKKVMRKVNRWRKKRNMDTFPLTCRVSAQIVPIQGITVSNYFYTTSPLLNATASTGIVQSAEFKLYQQLYDQVRINSVSIRVVPKANMLSQDQAQNDSSLNVSGDGLVHTLIDRDSDGVALSIPIWKRYPSYRSYSVLKPFRRSYSVKYPRGVWLDTQNIFEDTSLLKRLGLTGGIYMYAENLLEDKGELFNEPFATIEYTYNCVFMGRAATSTSVASDGSVTVKALEGSDIAPTPLVGIKGTIADTAVVQNDADGDGVIDTVPVTDDTRPE